MTTTKFFISLINASERAANIARVCRDNEKLFELLIQEKTDPDEKNPRFFQDFKTLADVVIQETIKYHVGKEFPLIRDQIRGEESNKFENTLGESVTVEISDDSDETKAILLKVLDGNQAAAEALTQEIFKEVEVDEKIPNIENELDLSNLGIWIDPIDATQEYISGNSISSELPNIDKAGLSCATVLIGVHDNTKPIFGVINQPFFKHENGSYSSKIFWGASINKTTNINNIPESQDKKGKIAIISSAEPRKYTLESAGYTTVASAGAGYKILKVILNDADIYFLSKGTTFKWDTCAGHAILNSLGGEMIDLNKSIQNKRPIPLTYKSEENKANQSGLIAYRNVIHLINLIPSFL